MARRSMADASNALVCRAGVWDLGTISSVVSDLIGVLQEFNITCSGYWPQGKPVGPADHLIPNCRGFLSEDFLVALRKDG
jgi:hypothetical protein